MALKPEENIMEIIWDNMPKSPDPEHVTFTEEDIEEIWLNGFVNDETYSLKDWAKAFEPHKTPEGDYLLKKEDFLEKDKYRFTGEIKIPFEPLLINEGKYTDEGLNELIDMSIAPSCSKSPKEIQEFFEAFKEAYREKDDLIRMDMQGKREITHLIYENPSPARRRELIFDAIFAQQMAKIAAGKWQTVTATPEQVSQIQVSTFTTIPSQAQKASKELESIEKAKKPKATGSMDEGVEIKKVRRSRKGQRG